MLTGAENLRMMARLRTQPRARADELLERFDLVEAADRRVATYSGGMQRRLDIAMSLVARPRCCSSTSRRPGWTRAAGAPCGRR